MFERFFGRVSRTTPSAAGTLLAIAALAMTTTATAAGDPEAGEALAAPCAACHGADGNSPSAEWPSLAGQWVGYTVRQLQAYQSGDRDDPLMTGQVINLSEQDMLDLAAFYAAQTLQPRAAGEGDLTLGERIYRGGNTETGVSACIACHGPDGLGNPLANYPRVSGQHATYLYDTLRDYAAGERRSDALMGEMMRDIAGRMSDAEMRAVAAYMQGLQWRWQPEP